jgi:hypothetical protein
MSLKRKMTLEEREALDGWTHDVAQAVVDLLSNDEQVSVYTAIRQVLTEDFSQSDSF